MPYDEYGREIDEAGNLVYPEQPPAGADGFAPLPNVGVDYGPMTEAGYDPGSYAGGNSSSLAGLGPSTLDRFTDAAKDNKAEMLALIERWRAENLPGLQAASAGVDRTQAEQLAQLNDVFGGASAIDFHAPQAAIVSEAAKAQADPTARAAQLEALNKLRGFTDPKVTAIERYMQEQARTAAERDQRSHREAALRSMAARGVRSGGAEMAALVGGQQVSSANRLMSDLGTQAGAMQRALNATGEFGRLGSTIAGQTFGEQYQRGQASDWANQFNTQQSAAYQRERTAHLASERDKGVERGKDRYAANVDAATQGLGRKAMLSEMAWKPTAAAVGATESGNAGVMRALELALGAEEAAKAREAMKPPEKPAWQKFFHDIADPGGFL